MSEEQTTFPEAPLVVLASLGLLGDYQVFHVFGYNASVDTVAEEDVWPGGGDYGGFDATSAEKLDVVSTSVNDTAAGTGMRTIQLTGMDGNYARQSETITLAATVPVQTDNSYVRLDSAVGVTFGSGGSNAGAITIDNTTSSDVFASITAGYNSDRNGIYTVPAGRKALVYKAWIGFSVNTATPIIRNESHYLYREQNAGWVFSFPAVGGQSIPSAWDAVQLPLLLPEKTDFKARASVSVNNTRVGSHAIILEVVA